MMMIKASILVIPTAHTDAAQIPNKLRVKQFRSHNENPRSLGLAWDLGHRDAPPPLRALIAQGDLTLFMAPRAIHRR